MGVLVILFYFLFPAYLLFYSTRFSIINKIGVVVICYAGGLVIGNMHIIPESLSWTQDLLVGLLDEVSVKFTLVPVVMV